MYNDAVNKFYLIRHGNRPDIAGDPELSELGIKQAILTAEVLKDKKISRIFCSPLKRARGTACVIADKLEINTITIDDRLKERFNWGDDPTQSFEEFIAEWQKTTHNRNYLPPAGDSSHNSGERLKDFINELCSKVNNETILIVTHGGITADLLRNLFDDAFIKTFKPDFLEAGIQECSITELIVDNGQYELKDFANGTHLPEPVN